MSLVSPYPPLYTLKPIDDNIWLVDGPIIHMQQFGLNVPFPTRMTVIRLDDGALMVHSPIQPSAQIYTELDRLGEVKHLISPNKIHYASIGLWSDHYPDAICWASPGVRERAQQHQIEIRFDQDLKDTAESAWSDEVDQLIFKGGKFMHEVVFFHKASSTLILADLIENFEASKVSVWIRWLLKLAGNLDPDGKMPIDLRMTYLGKHALACESYRRMLSWQAERIIIAHGRCYESAGVQELKRAFRWLDCPE